MGEKQVTWGKLKASASIELLGVAGKPVQLLDRVYTYGENLEYADKNQILEESNGYNMLMKKITPQAVTNVNSLSAPQTISFKEASQHVAALATEITKDNSLKATLSEE